MRWGTKSRSGRKRRAQGACGGLRRGAGCCHAARWRNGAARARGQGRTQGRSGGAKARLPQTSLTNPRLAEGWPCRTCWRAAKPRAAKACARGGSGPKSRTRRGGSCRLGRCAKRRGSRFKRRSWCRSGGPWGHSWRSAWCCRCAEPWGHWCSAWCCRCAEPWPLICRCSRRGAAGRRSATILARAERAFGK